MIVTCKTCREPIGVCACPPNIRAVYTLEDQGELGIDGVIEQMAKVADKYGPGVAVPLPSEYYAAETGELTPEGKGYIRAMLASGQYATTPNSEELAEARARDTRKVMVDQRMRRAVYYLTETRGWSQGETARAIQVLIHKEAVFRELLGLANNPDHIKSRAEGKTPTGDQHECVCGAVGHPGGLCLPMTHRRDSH